MESRKENELCQFYTPNGTIERFISLVGAGNNLVYILSAANGIGKTVALVNIAINIIWGRQNRFFDYPIFRNWPYEKRIRFISEPSQVKESGPFPTEWKKWAPRGKYNEVKAGQHYTSMYVAGDWIVEVLSYEQPPQAHEGANVGLLLFNEPPPQNLWTPNISRLRGGGMAVVGMTPLTSAGYLFDTVIPRHKDFVVYAGVETACKQHGKNGHLDHEQIEKMTAEYDPDERMARIDGQAIHLKGLIFKSFDPNIHILKEPVVCPPHASCYQVIDPHDDKPFAITYAFPDSRGDIYIHDEWPTGEDFYKMRNCQLTVDDYIKIFRDKEQKWHMYKRIMDRRFGEVSHAGNRRTLREEFQLKGYNFDQSYSAQEEIETGILKVRQYLSYDTTKPITDLNHPKLYINPHCINTIKSLSMWSRDPNNGKVQEAYKDFCDNLRYLLMANPRMDEEIPRNSPNRYG